MPTRLRVAREASTSGLPVPVQPRRPRRRPAPPQCAGYPADRPKQSPPSNPPPTGRSSGRRSPAPSPINALSPTARCSAMHSVRTAGERPPHLPIPRTGGTKSMALIRSGGPAASSCGGRRRSPTHAQRARARLRCYVPPTGGTRCTGRVRMATAQVLAPGVRLLRPAPPGGRRSSTCQRPKTPSLAGTQGAGGPTEPSLIAGPIVLCSMIIDERTVNSGKLSTVFVFFSVSTVFVDGV